MDEGYKNDDDNDYEWFVEANSHTIMLSVLTSLRFVCGWMIHSTWAYIACLGIPAAGERASLVRFSSPFSVFLFLFFYVCSSLQFSQSVCLGQNKEWQLHKRLSTHNTQRTYPIVFGQMTFLRFLLLYHVECFKHIHTWHVWI